MREDKIPKKMKPTRNFTGEGKKKWTRMSSKFWVQSVGEGVLRRTFWSTRVADSRHNRLVNGTT